MLVLEVGLPNPRVLELSSHWPALLGPGRLVIRGGSRLFSPGLVAGVIASGWYEEVVCSVVITAATFVYSGVDVVLRIGLTVADATSPDTCLCRIMVDSLLVEVVLAVVALIPAPPSPLMGTTSTDRLV